MEIQSMKTFYSNKENKDISLYLNYLENLRVEMEEGLFAYLEVFAVTDEEVINLQKQLGFIGELVYIIENSVRELLSNSISKMSNEELLEIIEKYTELCNTTKSILIKNLDILKEEENTQEQALRKEFEGKGYKEEYYKAKDTDYFFAEIKSSKDYIREIICNSEAASAFDQLVSNFEHPSNQRLLEVFTSLRKIAKVSGNSKDTLDKAIEAFLAPEKLGYPIDYDFFRKIQQRLKVGTEFFKNLPQTLQDEIIQKGISESSCYTNLKMIYLDYKTNGKISLPKSSATDDLKQQIASYEEDISDHDKTIEALEEIKSSREKMVELVQNVIKENDKDISYGLLSDKIEAYNAEAENIQSQIQELTDEIASLQESQNSINKVMSSSEYAFDLEVIEARNAIRIMNALGTPATEAAITPILDLVDNRLNIYRVILDNISYLNDLKKQIEDIDNSHNIIKKMNGENKRLREKMLTEYVTRCDLIFEDIKQSPTVESMYSNPKNFRELFNQMNIPNYQLSEAHYQELIERKIIPNSLSLECLNEQLNDLCELIKKMFSIVDMNNYLYEFRITSEEAEEIIMQHRKLVGMYKGWYESRKKEREELIALVEGGISMKLRKLLNKLGIKEWELTGETLKEYAENLKAKEIELEEQKVELGKKLEQGKINEKAYYELLEGFDEVTLPTDVAKSSLTQSMSISCSELKRTL